MPNPQDLKMEVNAAIDAAAEVPSTPAENVSSTPEVKESVVEPVAPIEKDPLKLKEQIDNLNIALKTERDSNKTKIEEMKKKLEESVSSYEKIKNVFAPPQEEKPQEPIYATSDDVDKAVEKKLQALKEDQIQNQKVEEYKKEIKSLETEWDGQNGKPKYDDEEVLNWQRENEKTYLSPKDAFLQMKHNELLDYEVKQRLSGVKPVIEVEKPSSMSGNHPSGDSVKNADINTRDAIRQAMEEVSKEM
jgi:hypothetical protein